MSVLRKILLVELVKMYFSLLCNIDFSDLKFDFFFPFSLPSPFIYNCTSCEQSPYTWGEFINALMQMVLKYPLPKSYQTPSLTMCKNSMKYKLFSILDHYIPAIVIDILLWISGSKLR